MNVFCDFHHASLLQSFILLFEGRLGGKVYRPIGIEWAEKGYWKVYDHPATQAQFLGIGGATPDGSPKLNEVVESYPAIGIYYCHDIDSDQTNKAITFEEFMRANFDIVIASIPAHVEPFKRLCAIHPNHPKLIFQIGNAWTIEAAMAPNVMASAKIAGVPEGINFIEYHQEFDTKVFCPEKWSSQYGIATEEGDIKVGAETPVDMIPAPNINSFVNVFNGQNHFAGDWQLFQRVEQEMRNFTFRSYGGQCRDGAVGPAEKLADTMRKSAFIWHTKAGGDGYGHVIHNAAAVGRPLIVKKQYYQGKMAENLIKDGETAICIDDLSVQEIIEKIRYYAVPERYIALCHATYENFKQVCNFDRELKDTILPFLEKLL